MRVISQEVLFIASALLCAVVAAVYDVKSRRIPNLLTGTSVLLALGSHLILGGVAQFITAALAGVIAGSTLLIFFIAGGMGAGDVKLMTAIGCFVGLHPLINLLYATALIGALFGLIAAHWSGRTREVLSNSIALIQHHLRHGLVQHPELNVSNAETLRIPFALPIMVGCLITLGAQVWSVQ